MLFWGIQLLAWAQTIMTSTIPTAGSEPKGITQGPDGALWYTELYGDNIGRISVTGAITEYLVLTKGAFPYLITAGPDGRRIHLVSFIWNGHNTPPVQLAAGFWAVRHYVPFATASTGSVFGFGLAPPMRAAKKSRRPIMLSTFSRCLELQARAKLGRTSSTRTEDVGDSGSRLSESWVE